MTSLARARHWTIAWARSSRTLPVGLGCCVALACGVPAPQATPTGIDLSRDAGRAPDCARGFVVIGTDYQSSTVAIVAPDGEVLAPSLLSSGSADPELSAALGGDVVLPTQQATGDELILLDRYPASVVTWLDLATAEVRAQLSVATGFLANPHDYVAVSPTRAYVTRFESNPSPGAVPHDGGGDLLRLDPSAPAIEDRVDLAPAMTVEADAPLPRPDRALLVGSRVIVLLGAHAADFSTSAESRLVSIDAATDRQIETLVLRGVHGCAGLALAPNGDELAVACSGDWGGDGIPELATSALVRVQTQPSLSELTRVPAAAVGAPLGDAVAYASQTQLLFTTLGRFANGSEPAADDTVQELELTSGSLRELLRSDRVPFSLGDVACDGCGVCLVADAQRHGGLLHRLVGGASGMAVTATLTLDDGIGLPPRRLGRY